LKHCVIMLQIDRHPIRPQSGGKKGSVDQAATPVIDDTQRPDLTAGRCVKGAGRQSASKGQRHVCCCLIRP
jgi:hypothetical protein